jgi:hypothetical protein
MTRWTLCAFWDSHFAAGYLRCVEYGQCTATDTDVV